MSTTAEISAPATHTADWRYPTMKPTPSSAGATSSASSAFGRTGSAALQLIGDQEASAIASLIAAPTAMPRKIQRSPAPAVLGTVARSTSAHAVPSG